ncbi:MAG: CSLREA domain-containing protein [Xanthomonadales bacterium]|nr:hypothetical protein [Xanthomonadales bacterium]MCC6593871.1 CSLREA domain-containing protein [Xanthomonadales bacterium]MCE7931040.1 CSLREA domain-containing protein [Xanthomonadales bacterium PRO6]
MHRDCSSSSAVPEDWLRRLRPWLVLMLLMASHPAWSQATCTWNVNGAGSWDLPGNWNGCVTGNGTPAGTPGPADHAVIGNIAPNAVVDIGSVDRTVNRLTLSAGRIRGIASLTVTLALVWSGGEIDGDGSVTNTLTLSSGSTADFGGSEHRLRQRDLVNLGEITWMDGDVRLFEGAEIDNQGVILINPEGGVRGLPPPAPLLLLSDGSPGTRLHNSANTGVRIDKEGDGLAEIAVNFDNGNAVNVVAGALRISAIGSDFGTYDVGGELEFAISPFTTRTLTGSPAVTGDGTVRKLGPGDLVVNGDYLLTGSTEVREGVLNFDTPADPLLLPDVVVQEPGTLTGADNLRIDQSLLWAGGNIHGVGSGLSLTLPASASALVQLGNTGYSVSLNSRDLINQGTLTVNANANLSTQFWLEAASIDNQGLFVLQNASTHNLLLDCLSTDCGSFTNQPGATVRMDDAQLGVIRIGQELLAFHNAGLVELVQGCGGVGAPGVDTGTYRYGGSCTFGLFPRAGRARTLEASVVLDQQGNSTLQIGGAVTVNGASRQFGNLILDPLGVLQGPADFEFLQNFIWRGEIFATQTVRTATIAAGALAITSDLPADTPMLTRRTLNLDGQLTISDVRLGLSGDATLRNTGVLRMTGTPATAAAIGCAAPPPNCGTVHNDGGTIQIVAAASGPAAVIEADVVVNNDGSLRVTSGVAQVEATFTAAAGSDVDIGVGAGLRRTGGPLMLAAGTLRGRGVVDGNLTVDAVTIKPAASGIMGTLGVLGNFTATSNTVYEMDVGGTAPEDFPRIGVVPPRGSGPEYDRFAVSGGASLAGTLNVVQVGGFTPTPSDFFDLLTYATYGGNIVPGANPFSGFGFVLLTQPTRVRLAQPSGAVVCVWNPGGSGPDDWTNPNKWTGCSTGSGPGPGPVGTPGAPDTAVVGGGVVNLDVAVGVGELQFTGGFIQGPNDINILDHLIWTGGRFVGSSAQSVTVQGGGSAELSGGQHTIEGRVFNLDGFATWTTGLIELANGGVLRIGSGGTLLSNPSLALESVFASGTGTGELQNFGTILKNGANSSGINANVQYVGAGSINVSDGGFIFGASSSASLDGSYTVAAGATLHFVTNNRSFGSLATLGGLGTLVFGDSGPGVGVNSVAGCLTPASNLVVRHAQVVLDCASPTQLDSLLMLESAGVLEGSSEIQIAMQFNWGHGTIRGTGPAQRIVLLAGGNGSFPAPQGNSNPRRLQGRRLINHGILQWTGANDFAIDGGAIFENDVDGVLEFSGTPGSRAFVSDLTLSPLLIHRGIFGVLDGTTVHQNVPWNNSGLVDVTDGQFNHRYPATDGGSYSIGSTGVLAFDAVSFTLDGGSTLSGSGSVDVINGSALSVLGSFAPSYLLVGTASSIAFNAGSPALLQNVLLNGGTLTGSDEVQVGGTMQWDGGSVIGSGASPGPLWIQPGAALVLHSPPHTLDNRVLRIAGNGNWSGGSILVPQNQAAKIDVPAGGTLQLSNAKTGLRFGCDVAPCTAEFELAGSLLQTGSGVDLELTSPLLMTGGLLDVNSQLSLDNGLQVTDGIVQIDPAGGQLQATPVILDGGVLRGGEVFGELINNAGSVQPGASPGELTINGDYVQGASGSLSIEVSGLIAGTQSDYLSSSGTITLDGALIVSRDGYTLTDPDTLEFLSAYGGLSGTFASTSIDHPGYIVEYGTGVATLVPGGPVALVVNSIDDIDDGSCDLTHCSLREALNQANLMPDADQVHFNIPQSQCGSTEGPCTISPLTPLPVIVHPLVVDGYTQPNTAPNTQAAGLGLGSNADIRIEINGENAGGDGLVLNTPSFTSSEVRGLALFHWNRALVAQGPVDNQVVFAGNFVGLDANGNPQVPASSIGIALNGGSVTVGGATAAAMNVISGNGTGLRIDNPIAGGSVTVRGNLIGTSVDGLGARPNMVGIDLHSSQDSPTILIGGNEPDHRNVISGNSGDGLRFDCNATAGNCFDNARVQGNYIGPQADGAALGNGDDGIDLANMNFGLAHIGGIIMGEGNRIAFNGDDGIVGTFSGARASFVRNEIYQNTGEGIDLGDDGRTPNDVGDPDVGANGLLNFPRFISYTAPGGNSAIIDVLLDTPDIGGNYPARVDFYLANEDEPGTWLGSTDCAQPAVSCNASFSFPGGITVAPEDIVLGIVTDGFGKSSEASFYASSATIISDSPDPSVIGTPYTVAVSLAGSDSPFAPRGVVDIDDGAGNTCQATLALNAPAVATGSCQLPSLAPAGGRTLTAVYNPGSVQPFASSSAQATHTVASATVVVNSSADPGNGVCDASECTLREGVALANSAMLQDVDFDSAFFSVPRVITLTAGEITTSRSVNINGPGAALLTVSGNNATRIFELGAHTVNLSGATLTGGAGVVGAAIRQTGGTLGLTDVVLTGNNCAAAGTGTLASLFGTLTLTRVTVAGNVCANVSGAYLQDGTATIVDSTFSGNSGADGEALRVTAASGPASATLTNVTVSGNSTINSTAGISAEPLSTNTVALTLINVTISGNSTSSTGGFGALWLKPAGGTSDVLLRNTIVAGNTVGGLPRDIDGNVNTTSSFNVIGVGGGLTNGGNGNQTGVNTPLLAPLANYGGSTQTRALLPGSPALNTGSNALAPAFDQRGIARPQLAVADVGAFESRGFGLALVSGSPQTTPVNAAFPQPLVVGVTANAAGEPVDGGAVTYIAPGTGASATFSSPAIIAGGQASLVATANAIVGSYAVTANASGASGAPSFALTNGSLPTSTTILSVLPATTVVGQPYTVSVGVSDGVAAVATGIVQVRQLSDGALCTIDLANASSCQLAAGSAVTTAVRANYLGAGVYAPSQSGIVTHDVTRGDTMIAIVEDSPDPSAVLQPVLVRVTLDLVTPAAGVPTGEILVTDGVASCTAVLPNLSCTLIPKALGAATLEARYAGDANFNPSTDTEAHMVVADGADLAIIARNGLRLIPPGQQSTYVLLVTNSGPQSVVNARVTDILPPQFSAANWTCTAADGSSCPPNGNGNVDALVSIGSASSVTFELTATAQAGPEQVVTNTATVASPANAPDPDLSNNTSTDSDPMGYFADGFENENE